jgi:signal transduction histidine kinase
VNLSFLRATAWIALAVGAVAIGVYYLLPGDGQSVFYVVIGAAAVGGMFVGANRKPTHAQRVGWYVLTLGMALEVAGDAVGSFYELFMDKEPPVPGLDDLFYLLGYPLLVVGVFLLVQRVRRPAGQGAIVDAISVFLAVALVQWVFFIDPYNHAGITHEGQRLVLMAYPALDTLLVVAVGQLVLRYARNVSFAFLLTSIVLLVTADEIFAIKNAGYANLPWLDAFYLGSYVLVAAAALHPSSEKLQPEGNVGAPRLTLPRVVLLGGALLTAPAVLLVEKIAGHRVHTSIGIFGAGIAVVVLVRLVGLFRDSDRARLSEQWARREAEVAQRLLTMQNTQLRELDRLKDEFLSGVSHELRTPLTSIIGYVELLREEEKSPVRVSYLQIIERNAERLIALVADVLFAARLQEGQLKLDFEPLDLGRLVTHAIEEAEPRAVAAGVELIMSREELPQFRGESSRLAQLLDNLVSNAIKFTPSGGRVDVNTSAQNGVVRIEVSDTGLGISEDDREHLFERFFRSQTALERQIQGTGLGLYISKAIVEAHGGRIGVSSVVGEGTTFVVELPVTS